MNKKNGNCIRERADCFEVTVTRKKQRFSKRFSFSKYGKKKSGVIAEKYRDHLFARERKMSLAEYMDTERANNTSGKTGVYLHKIRKNDVDRFYWQARCVSPEPNKRFDFKYFSIQKYGGEEAKQKAIAARNEMLKKWEDDYFRG
jgi:hypothetical protein